MKRAKHLTLRQIAELAGTSKSTVSRVLTGNPRISESTRRKVLRVVEKHQYRPNQLARSLARGRSGLISVISANIGRGFFADVIRGIDLVATNSRVRLLCSFAHSVDAYLSELREMALSGQVEGVILVAPYADLFDQELLSSVPVVLCAAKPREEQRRWTNLDSVTLNNRKAMSEMVEHLVDQGFRRLIHLAGWRNHYDAVDRESAFRAAAARYPEIQSEILSCGLIREDGQKVAHELPAKFARGSTAFIAVNDSTAFGFTEVWKERRPGTRWPVAVTGWDNSPAAEAFGLTSVAIPTYELGQACARVLLDRVTTPSARRGPRHEVVDLDVRIRESSLRGVGEGP